MYIYKNQGDSKYTAVHEENDIEDLQKDDISDEDMFDEMIDINGKTKEDDMFDNYSDDESWEVDSDAYSVSSVSSGDESSSFINDGTTDYETTDSDDDDDDF